MAQLEENDLASCNTRPLTYLWFIDDILIIWTALKKELLAFHQRFNQFHPPSTLPLTTLTHTSSSLIQPSTSKNGTIQTSLYQKPTGRPAYLMWDSFHPHHIKKSIVFSQVIDDQIHRATQIPRNTVLDYKEKTENNRVLIVVTYNPQLNIIRKIARDLQPMLHTDTRLKQIFPELPLLSYRQSPNLIFSPKWQRHTVRLGEISRSTTNHLFFRATNLPELPSRLLE
ncbi:hypothetical protein XELAEV_18004993mg [Xenopus laevis]|uniref:Reverse transcriptase domain-containing protein n=1 Tax=Xenopus laevis TaxID=8355 RepID=A0A974DXQ2_XENLA|nr:hypothetical protein XELAEV_18004993mg [Xenopus laevis]